MALELGLKGRTALITGGSKGIGLAIVRKAAERMGGEVGIDSQPKKGSRFWLEFASASNDSTHA